MRAGIYARYSSDNQNERSIEDQLRLCREFAARRGDAVTDIFADYEISGSSLKTRPQALRLLDEIRAGRIQVVITEDLDRLSRDQEDIAFIYKRARFASVPILTLSDGEINELHIGLKGTMNAIELRKLADKTRRGLRGRVEAGFSAGGLSYGYKVVRELDASGELKRGLRTIDPAEAAIVKRVFSAYLAGQSARAIAAALNRDGVPAPFGKQWNASTINGNPQRGNGILCNALYAGRLVYNRVRMIKDPETGKRVSRLNPPAEWTTQDLPELQIISADDWEAVQARKRAVVGVPARQQLRPKHLFSGLVRCSHCGGAYVIRTRDKLGCSNHHESATCGNGARIAVTVLERRVLDGIKAKLLSPEAIRDATAAYHAERNRLAAGAGEQRRTLERRIAQLSREIKRGVEAVFDGTASRAMRLHLVQIEAEKDQAEAELRALAQAAKDVVIFHPGVIASYTNAVEDLRSALAAEPQHQAEAVALLRQLVERIDITPSPEAENGFAITAHGSLAALLRPRNDPGTRLTVQVVAGEGLEPPTLGL
jgi:site-specific DNA recombinase